MYGLPKLQTFWISKHTNEESFSKWMGASPKFTFLMQGVKVSNAERPLTDDDQCHEALAA